MPTASLGVLDMRLPDGVLAARAGTAPTDVVLSRVGCCQFCQMSVSGRTSTLPSWTLPAAVAVLATLLMVGKSQEASSVRNKP